MRCAAQCNDTRQDPWRTTLLTTATDVWRQSANQIAPHIELD
ncbi:Uncharacterised protein [Vibrio cholerae]|nr:Uncharacterised protein [Vibrio cholerae]CSB55802.1 Uncharacterised protein [Vibrio cholerae]CSC06022.1 Uncharacterised protein [Vibrio cholerae]CSI00581.1 Uncharacterised protein [Vibrio cholerae]CSI82049.1 Uncharacterised protein [Vibrio cholerae]